MWLSTAPGVAPASVNDAADRDASVQHRRQRAGGTGRGEQEAPAPTRDVAPPVARAAPPYDLHARGRRGSAAPPATAASAARHLRPRRETGPVAAARVRCLRPGLVSLQDAAAHPDGWGSAASPLPQCGPSCRWPVSVQSSASHRRSVVEARHPGMRPTPSVPCARQGSRWHVADSRKRNACQHRCVGHRQSVTAFVDWGRLRTGREAKGQEAKCPSRAAA